MTYRIDRSGTVSFGAVSVPVPRTVSAPSRRRPGGILPAPPVHRAHGQGVSHGQTRPQGGIFTGQRRRVDGGLART